uniref:Predicted gene 44965 n=1 Tax=Mus musculus TaxID=10090 RepID=A0A0N4SVR3_MOUSE
MGAASLEGTRESFLCHPGATEVWAEAAEVSPGTSPEGAGKSLTPSSSVFRVAGLRPHQH